MRGWRLAGLRLAARAPAAAILASKEPAGYRLKGVGVAQGAGAACLADARYTRLARSACAMV